MDKKNAVRLVLVSYGVAVLGLLMVTMFNFLYDSYLFASSKIEPVQYTTEQMELSAFTLEENGTITAETSDPQILINEYNKSAVMIVMDMECSGFPGEVTIYYTRNPNEDFSVNKKIYATQKANGEYEFILPRGKLSKIRVDPTNFAGINIKFNKFELNPKRSFINYFAFTGEVLFNISVWPAIVAALLAWACQALKSSGFVFIRKKAK